MLLPALLLAALGGSPPQDPGIVYGSVFLGAWDALEAGEVEEARAGFLRCRERRPGNPIVAVYLACTEARSGNVAAGLDWLERAAEEGYDDPAYLRWEPDLAGLRGEPAFEPLLDRMRTRGGERREVRGLAVRPRLRDLQYVSEDHIVENGIGDRWDLLAGSWTGHGEQAPSADEMRRENGVPLLETHPVQSPSSGPSLEKTGAVWISPDGTRAIYVPVGARGFELWDLARRERLLSLPGLHHVDSACFSASGDQAVVIAFTRQFTLDTRTGEVAEVPIGKGVDAWSPIAVGFRGEELQALYHTDGGQVCLGGPARTDPVVLGESSDLYQQLDVASGGEVCLTRSNGVVRVFETAKGKLLWSASGVTGARFTRDGDWLLLVRKDRLESVRSSSGRVVHRFEPAVQVGSPIASLDGTHHAVTCSDGTLRRIETATGRLISILSIGEESVYDIDLGATGAVALTTRDGRFRLWPFEGADDPLIDLPGRDEHPWTHFSLSPDGGRVAVWGGTTQPGIFDTESGGRLLELAPDLRDAVWRTDSSLATLSPDGRVRLIDTMLGGTRAEWRTGRLPFGLACTPDGSRILTLGPSLDASLHHAESGELEFVISHGPGIWGNERLTSWSLSNRHLVTFAGNLMDAWCWDLANGQEIWEYDSGGGGSMSIDGQLIYMRGAGSPKPGLLELSTGEKVKSFDHLARPRAGTDWQEHRWVGNDRSGVILYDPTLDRVVGTRFEGPRGSHLLVSPGHQFSPGGLLASLPLHVETDGGWQPASCYSAWLVDPKRVQAALAGVASTSTRVPTLPSIELETTERVVGAGPSPRLQARAERVNRVHSFEVTVNGQWLDMETVASATRISADGTTATLDLPLSVPSAEVPLHVAVATINDLGATSLPAWITFVAR